jgi:hypothetical protein
MRTVNLRAFPRYFVCCGALLAGCSDTGTTLPNDTTTAGTSTGAAGSNSSAGAAVSAGTGSVTPAGGSATAAGTDAGGSVATGGSAVAGGSGGGGGSSSGGSGPVGFTRPEGQLPNTASDPSTVNVSREDYAKDLISPTFLAKHHLGQFMALNGYLAVMGNEEFWFYDIKDPKKPAQLSEFLTPNREPTGGPKLEGEAESHTASFAKYGDKYYLVTTGGHGVDIWDVTNQKAVKHVKQLKLDGIAYGDFTAAVWGLSWQGNYIYVGGTDQGLFILDAHDPLNVTVTKRIPTSAFGTVSAGPLDAIGNILVITTPKESGGIATMDISDPVNPVYLHSIKPSKSYIGMFYRHFVFLQTPLRAWDVLTDPTNIGTANAPIGSLNTDDSEYMSFSDNYMFLGFLRPNSGAAKIDVTDPSKMSVKGRVWGRLDLNGDNNLTNGTNDDQFTLAIGSLVVLGDDEAPYAGAVIGAHSVDPDSKPPVVDTVIPKDKETGRSVKSRIGVTFTDNIELATVNDASFIVRPMGGDPIKGVWGLRMGVLNFSPAEDLKPATTYEVILPKGGVTDLVRNALAEDFKSTFTTK